MLKLSIITINYNNLSGLKKTLTSVLVQTFSNFEHIIIDGGSTDGSKELIAQYANRFSYWVSEKDDGVYHAMNKGIKVAKGEYLLFLNSGDWFYDDNILQTVNNYLSGCDIIFGDVINIKKDGTKWLHKSPPNPSLYYLGYNRNSLPHQAMFLRKDLFEKYGGYDESLKMVSDWTFYLTLLYKYNCSYQKIDNIIAYYDFEGFSSKVENDHLQDTERAWVIDKYFKNHVDLLKEYSYMKSELWKYEHSRLIKSLRKIGFLKF